MAGREMTHDERSPYPEYHDGGTYPYAAPLMKVVGRPSYERSVVCLACWVYSVRN